jgi:hypothetical protein
MDLHQDLIVCRSWFFNVLELENIGRSIASIRNGFHQFRIIGDSRSRTAVRVVTQNKGQ